MEIEFRRFALPLAAAAGVALSYQTVEAQLPLQFYRTGQEQYVIGPQQKPPPSSTRIVRIPHEYPVISRYDSRSGTQTSISLGEVNRRLQEVARRLQNPPRRPYIPLPKIF